MAMTASRTRVHHKILEIRDITDTTYVLRFERHGLSFQPGQYLSVGPRGDINMREYSIYSPVQAEYLEILIREVDGGFVSRQLRKLSPGDELNVEGPFGFFLMDEDRRKHPLLFIATGTGISPFHCFAGSYSDLDYRLLHGVRTNEEQFELDSYDRSRLVRCVSREDGGDYSGRVSDYLRQHPVHPDASVYLCGNCDMIYEAYDILSEQGLPRDRIFAEVYF